VERIRAVPDYIPLFREAFRDVTAPADITIVHIGNAIGAFINSEWRADKSPFDAYLRGDASALGAEAKRGLDLFYGKAGCVACHSGKFQTDHDFHAIAMPQFGPGRTRLFDPVARDQGRLNESDDRADAHKFRTPSLRNVAATAPYGHTGAYRTLEAIVRHHLDPESAFRAYDPSQAILPADEKLSKTDFLVFDNRREMAAILAANELEPVHLSDWEISDLLAFLNSLTDKTSLKGRLGAPKAVPSGLPLD
ncbi:MAG: c-type cytochrome, partial [Rhodospirillales bacterium]|nr:c-type cytochrome [Rhodospirillales bacterium]